MTTIAAHIIGLLLEDRVDDLIARYPALKLNRPKLTKWLEFDPTNNKKYFPWIIKQVSLKKLKLPSGGERLRDDLMRFERLLTLPMFTGHRDIGQYDVKTLNTTIRQTSGLQSKTEKEKEDRFKNVKVVGKSGSIVVVEIKNAQELMNRAWQGYSKDNPNWDGKPIVPPRPGEEDNHDWDGLWCIRFPQYARSYLADGPFYIVYKNGGVYVGIVFERGECQTLHNEGISLGMAEEIYPALKSILDQKSKEGEGLKRNCYVFANLRFLTGDAEDGETVKGQNNKLDLSWSSLSRLPNNLTVKGTLDLTGCKIPQLPSGLTVSGGVLKIAGTNIQKIPDDLSIDEMEWSDPLQVEEVKKLFYRMRLVEMKKHFWRSDKLFKSEKDSRGDAVMVKKENPQTRKIEDYPKPVRDQDGNLIPMSEEEKEVEWVKFQPVLINYFMTSEKMETSAKTVLRYVSLDKIRRNENE